MNKQVSVHIIVKDGEKYIEECVQGVKDQTYPNVKVRVFNNASTDKTVALAKKQMPNIEIIDFDKNYSYGGGFNRSVAYSDSEYIILLCVDVVLDQHFIERAVKIMDTNDSFGVIQAKVFYHDKENNKKTRIIDTTGMRIFKSRRIINRGHGEKDTGQYDVPGPIFSMEGCVPFFRKKALDSVKMNEQYFDEDFELYGEDVDLGWRISLAGWTSWYAPDVNAWHDRSTTHSLSKGFSSFIAMRKHIDARKRMLDLRNQRLVFIKNDVAFIYLKHLPFILKREVMLLIYVILFERSSLKAYLGIMQKARLMISKRKVIMKQMKKTPNQTVNKWFE